MMEPRYEDVIEAAEAAVYDEHHVEWERDEWRDLANHYEAALKEIAALESVDPDGLWRAYKELFTVAREALGVGPSTNVSGSTNARMAERVDALEQRVRIDHGTMHQTFNQHQARLDDLERLKERLTQLEERLAVLEEDRSTPGMTPAQYVALRGQYGS